MAIAGIRSQPPYLCEGVFMTPLSSAYGHLHMRIVIKCRARYIQLDDARNIEMSMTRRAPRASGEDENLVESLLA